MMLQAVGRTSPTIEYHPVTVDGVSIPRERCSAVPDPRRRGRFPCGHPAGDRGRCRAGQPRLGPWRWTNHRSRPSAGRRGGGRGTVGSPERSNPGRQIQLGDLVLLSGLDIPRIQQQTETDLAPVSVDLTSVDPATPGDLDFSGTAADRRRGQPPCLRHPVVRLHGGWSGRLRDLGATPLPQR